MGRQQYEIIERIDVGGMAEVFKASSTSLKGFEKLVAIKRVLPSLTEDERFVQMFLDEAKIALPLNHANITQTFDLGLADETYFIVMEYVDGTDLEKLVGSLRRDGQRLDVEEVAFVALEVCKGLDHAHRTTAPDGQPLEIVHRDVSPPNILLSTDGEVQLTDFGLAKAKTQAQRTEPGVVKGKYGYLSPEGAEGEEVDPRTDIFAVGIVMWEMLTGERLFAAEGDFETLELVRRAEIPPIDEHREDVSDRLRSIVGRALERDPDDRFQTARSLGRALEEFLFAYGEPISTFDLVGRVASVLDDEQPDSEAADAEALTPEVEAAQQELDGFVSVEQIGGMDSRAAQRPGAPGSSPSESGADQRGETHSWSEFEEEFAFEQPEREVAFAGAGPPPRPPDDCDTEGSSVEAETAGRSGPEGSGADEADRADRSPHSDGETVDPESNDEGGLGAVAVGVYVALGLALAMLSLVVALWIV